MSDFIHKIKDTITHHHDHHGHADSHTGGKKPGAPDSHSKLHDARNDQDLNGAPSSTHDPLDLTGRHTKPDQRDLDGRRHSKDHDAPDLTGPHRDHDNVDINGHHASTHNPPDLNSPTAESNSRY
ncbi:hypothetical protein F4861DRAFT_489401 [Xylaria intraflava]|nr:hypothetical protein F4861DRAFT_489401 [Xylaria intraflava]